MAEAKKRARDEMRETLEDDIALRKRPDVEEWLTLVRLGQAAPVAEFSVRTSVARHITKHLPSESCIRTLSLASGVFLFGWECCWCWYNAGAGGGGGGGGVTPQQL